MSDKYIIITESALDAALVSNNFAKADGLPENANGVHAIPVAEGVTGYRTLHEKEPIFCGVVKTECIEYLMLEGGTPIEIFRRIARVLKGLKSPPVHLPRQWSEYHHRNLLAFFALPRDIASSRWIVELGENGRAAKFEFLTSVTDEVDLSKHEPTKSSFDFASSLRSLLDAEISSQEDIPDALTQEVDLQAIGSNSVVAGRTYEDWQRYLTPQQRVIAEKEIDTSIRIVGPAGSGKTLSLCLRAIQISRDADIVAQGKRVLVATHSWAMSERIDGILAQLNAGISPEGVTVFPLLSLLELHAGHIGQRRTEIIGDDSTDGRVKSLEIISNVLNKIDYSKFDDISPFLAEGLKSPNDSRSRIDLVINLYEEISGVLTASGVAPDDPNSIQEYISAKREDWMPPFVTQPDRVFAISVYKQFIQNLVDRAAITTDQFVLDSIRILETFTWRMRKETDGYDFIIVDELQLFDPQERSALELLGRSRKGVPFITAEDPSQGVFAALNVRRPSVDNVPVYLDTVHRFNHEIFNFISFLYQKFPLNAVPLKIAEQREKGKSPPSLVMCASDDIALDRTVEIVRQLSDTAAASQRICVVTLGDVDRSLVAKLEDSGLVVTRLESFDDVEQLAYRKKSIVVSPWQFIGGTQFSHVVVLAMKMNEQTSQFGRLREMVSVYLSCSRAADTLKIVCSTYVPPVLSEASDHGLLDVEN